MVVVIVVVVVVTPLYCFLPLLTALKITHVLNMSTTGTNPFQHLVKYLNIPAGDSYSFPLDHRFQEILDFIHDALGQEKVKAWGVQLRAQNAVYMCFCAAMTLCERGLHVA